MKHLLFICSSAIDRSPVAAELFENNRKYEAKYAGLNSWARIPLTKAAVDWADIIVKRWVYVKNSVGNFLAR